MKVNRRKQPLERRRKRILLVDDFSIVRHGMVHLLEGEPDLAVCGGVECGRDALRRVEETNPDLVIVEVAATGVCGIDLIRNIRKRCPGTAVLVFSRHEEEVYAERALRAGARGYVMKRENDELVLAAIRAVLNGELYLSPLMRNRLLWQYVGGESVPHGSPLARLSQRELTIYELIGRGRGTSQIAHNLHLSQSTIESYRQRLKEKLGLSTGAELVRAATTWVHEGKLDFAA